MEADLRWYGMQPPSHSCELFSRIRLLYVNQTEQLVPNVTSEMVCESFRHTAASAGAMDGIQGSLRIFFRGMHNRRSPLQTHRRRSTMAHIDQICQGSVPRKSWAAIGEVMSYRPLTITPPIYRAWATTRLRSMPDWVT